MGIEIWDNDIFKRALEAAPSGQMIVDKTGRICHINSKICRIFGYSVDELVEQQVEMLIPQEYRQNHPDHRQKFHKTPTVRNMGSGQILYGLHKSGKKIPVEIGLNPLDSDNTGHVLASVVDISERLKAEQRFQLALEASPNGILLMNNKGNIVLVNSRIEEIFGYSRDELINQPVEILIPDKHRHIHPSYIQRFLQQPRSRAMGSGRDLYGLRKDSKEVPLEIGLNPLDIAGITHVLASVVDISERKQSEVEKASLNNQIQHAQRLESLGVLAGGTAHDFNNILQAISGNADLAKIKLGRGEDVTRFLDNIIQACQRAADLTRQMLAYAGKGKMICSKENINDIINDISSLIDSSIPKKIRIEKSLASQLPLIEVDTSQIRQIILNLITNSSEAIGNDSGAIEISTGLSEETTETLERYRKFDYLKPGHYLYIEVKDTGQGMTDEVAEHIFDPFFTTKFTGRGLGMAAVLGIIRGHYGSIYLDSQQGGGTSIRIILPVAETTETSSSSAANESTEATNPLSNYSALIIDDEAEIISSLADILQMEQVNVKWALSGHEAMQLIDNGEDLFDLVFLDMNMPEMNGAEVYAELQRRKIPARIILMSGYNEHEVNTSISRLIGRPASEITFLPKPFTYNQLIKTIHQALEK
jgi:PAS domain S-box-containing protein